MSDPSVLDLVILRSREVSRYHWQFSFYQSVVLLAVWSAFALGLMGELEGEVIKRSLKQIFTDWSSSDLREPKVELVAFEETCIDLL